MSTVFLGRFKYLKVSRTYLIISTLYNNYKHIIITVIVLGHFLNIGQIFKYLIKCLIYNFFYLITSTFLAKTITVIIINLYLGHF